MASHPASPVPGAHSSLKPAALPAFPVEGASPPNTLEPLPFRTVKPEVRTWQLAFSPSGIFLLRTKESSTAPIKPSPRRPVWNSVAESLDPQGDSFLQDGQGAQELPRHGPPRPPTVAPLDGADCRETREKHAGLVCRLPLLLPSRLPLARHPFLELPAPEQTLPLLWSLTPLLPEFILEPGVSSVPLHAHKLLCVKTEL